MKSFSRYLVEKEVISEDDLLQIWVEQLRDIPSAIELVFKHKLLSTADTIRLIELQSGRSMDFRTACQHLNLWNSEFEQKLIECAKSYQKPLCQTLLQKHPIDVQQLIKLLDAYLPSVAQEAKIPEPPVEVASEPAPIPVAAPSPEPTTPQFETLDLSRVGSFLEFFSPIRVGSLRKVVASLSESATGELNEQLVSEALEVLLQGVHEIRGMARYSGATLTEQLIGEIEALIAKLNKHRSDKDLLLQGAGLLANAVEVLWEIRETLSISQSEATFWKEAGDKFSANKSELERFLPEVA